MDNEEVRESEPPEYRTPGQLIQALLDERGWSQKVLAAVFDTHATAINSLIAGRRPVDAKTALALGSLFGVPAEKFLELQKSYELAQARITFVDDPARIERANLFGQLPIDQMIRRGWLRVDDMRDFQQVESELNRFFRVESIADVEVFSHAAKKTNVVEDVTPVQLAWLYRVKELAEEMLVSKYSPESVQSLIAKLSTLRGAAGDVAKVPRLMTDAGIRFLIVESLPAAKIDGVCFWLNPTSPVIAMSLRFDRIDNFWFVLRHELEHVVQLHGQQGVMMLDADMEGERLSTAEDFPEEERVANIAAAEFCAPRHSMDQFISRKAPFYAERDIIGFSRTLRIHPGLIAGQLQHLTRRYDRFRNHLVKIRAFIAPNALVDGWGDVVPVGD